MGFIDLSAVQYVLGNGRVLLNDVSFRIGEGATVALVGANGTGKTTLLRLIAGDLQPAAGTISRAGGVGVMRQFIGSVRDRSTVAALLAGLAPAALTHTHARLGAAEAALNTHPGDETAAMNYAQAVADWSDAGGYEAEVVWNQCTMAALAQPFEVAGGRPVAELSGGEQKRLALEALFRGRDDVLLLDEPDNYLDVPAKRWLEAMMRDTRKTLLYISHDRELLAQTASRIVTIEGHSTWTHGGGFASYHEARQARHDRLDELHRRWEEEHQRLKELVHTLQQQAKISPAMAARYGAMQTRLRKFEEAGPPVERARPQNVRMRLRGGRTGVKALMCRQLELTGLMRPFDLEVYYGERVAVLGSNGSGKSHFLRLLAGEPVAHSGAHQLGARVVAGRFAQTHEHAGLMDRTLVDILWHHGFDRARAMGALRRYELQQQGDQSFGTLSGGQQARLQILLLEIGGATLLLLDEPTDNLDVESAEALEDGLRGFEGTVLAVTHDRWFARSFERFVVFSGDGTVTEATEPVWEEARPVLAR